MDRGCVYIPYPSGGWRRRNNTRNTTGLNADGRESKLQVLDWEVSALFWNCVKACNGDETLALEKVRAKYLDEFLTKDLHFFLGTTLQFHFVAPNPWVVIGVFPVPHHIQDDLFSQ